MGKVLAAALSGLLLPGGVLAQPDMAALTCQVEAAERAFAKTMADRDIAAFAAHLSEQAVFLRDPSGKPIARFTSVWRLEAPNTWRVVFDKGETWEEPQKP